MGDSGQQRITRMQTNKGVASRGAFRLGIPLLHSVLNCKLIATASRCMSPKLFLANDINSSVAGLFLHLLH